MQPTVYPIIHANNGAWGCSSLERTRMAIAATACATYVTISNEIHKPEFQILLPWPYILSLLGNDKLLELYAVGDVDAEDCDDGDRVSSWWGSSESLYISWRPVDVEVVSPCATVITCSCTPSQEECSINSLVYQFPAKFLSHIVNRDNHELRNNDSQAF
jgi:hypothetical protein